MCATHFLNFSLVSGQFKKKLKLIRFGVTFIWFTLKNTVWFGYYSYLQWMTDTTLTSLTTSN